MAQVSTEDFLAHYGVKGMKWGERRAHGKAMRGLDRESKEKDKVKRRRTIDKARERVQSGEGKQAVKDAKQQYKADKNVVGKREAKKVLNKAREKYAKDVETSKQLRDGKEVVAYLGRELFMAGASSVLNKY